MKTQKPKEGVVHDTADYYKEFSEKNFDPNVHLRADLWEKLSLNDLWLQHSLIQKRMNGAMRIGNYPMQEQIQRGIDRLLLIIEEKSAEIKDEKLIF